MSALLSALRKRQGKLHIVSAGVVGVIKESVEMLDSDAKDAVVYCGTQEEYDAKGTLVGFKEPTVTSQNKSSVITHEMLPGVKPGSNAIVMGDLCSDLLMIENLKLDTTVSVGFFCAREGESLEDFKRNFDVLVTGDGNLDWVVDLVASV